ncbi:MAG: 6-phosphogluconolactonase [Planctomycetota bacterium]
MKREIEFLPFKTYVFDDAHEAIESVAREMANLIRTLKYQRHDAVLGLTTGTALEPFYAKLVEMSGEEEKGGLPISGVRTFLHEELLGRGVGAEGSLSGWVTDKLYSEWPVPEANRHYLDGAAGDLEAECARYEEALKNVGPIDALLVPLGQSGRLALNEPGTDKGARTRVVDLSESAKEELSAQHPGLDLPAQALTLGPASIRGAKRVRVYAFGDALAEVVEAGMLPEADPDHPLSLLAGHKNVEVLLDPGAAASLE